MVDVVIEKRGMIPEKVDRYDCKHIHLHFGSGGYYLLCQQCEIVWVAKKSGGPEPEEVVDRKAGENGLGGFDIRSEPPIEGE